MLLGMSIVAVITIAILYFLFVASAAVVNFVLDSFLVGLVLLALVYFLIGFWNKYIANC